MRIGFLTCRWCGCCGSGCGSAWVPRRRLPPACCLPFHRFCCRYCRVVTYLPAFCLRFLPAFCLPFTNAVGCRLLVSACTLRWVGDSAVLGAPAAAISPFTAFLPWMPPACSPADFYLPTCRFCRFYLLWNRLLPFGYLPRLPNTVTALVAPDFLLDYLPLLPARFCLPLPALPALPGCHILDAWIFWMHHIVLERSALGLPACLGFLYIPCLPPIGSAWVSCLAAATGSHYCLGGSAWVCCCLLPGFCLPACLDRIACLPAGFLLPAGIGWILLIYGFLPGVPPSCSPFGPGECTCLGACVTACLPPGSCHCVRFIPAFSGRWSGFCFLGGCLPPACLPGVPGSGVTGTCRYLLPATNVLEFSGYRFCSLPEGLHILYAFISGCTVLLVPFCLMDGWIPACLIPLCLSGTCRLGPPAWMPGRIPT